MKLPGLAGSLAVLALASIFAFASATPAAGPASRPASAAEKAALNPAGVPGKDPAGTQAAYAARLKAMPGFDKPLMFNTPQADAVLKAVQVFPASSPYYEDISRRPLAANSAAMVAAMAGRRNLAYNLDMTYIVVPAEQKLVAVKIAQYPDESDPGPYPMPDDAPIEGWNPAGGQTLAEAQAKVEDADRHVILVDPARGLLTEFWQGRKTAQGWQASNAATFDMKTNALRPDGWTSSDAAGLPIFPLTVRYDDVAGGEVPHAIRFTARNTRAAYVYPATHKASSKAAANLPRMASGSA